MTARRVDPLTLDIPIADARGRPTPEFQRKWAQQTTINDGVASAADPTATASEVVVKGAAPTFMRSDAAPAVRKCSDDVFGLTKPDGVTIKADGGVISAQTGFGFFVGGLMTDHELLGAVVFPMNVEFTDDDPLTVCESQVPAAASAVLTLLAGTPPFQVGTITFAAGGHIGTVAWTVSPYTLTAGYIISIYGPSPLDATLSLVSGNINGSST